MTLPIADPAFHWTRESWGYALRCRPLERVAQHLFTTRQLRLRPTAAGSPVPRPHGGIAMADVAGRRDPVVRANAAAADAWREAAAAVGADLARIMRVKQVHGNTVHVLRERELSPRDHERRPEADAMVSDAPGLALAVQVADCAPILLADATTGVAAAVHAGWRGTCARVAAAAVQAMVREFGTDPMDLVAAIGPSIGTCCYEVGDELLEAFREAGVSRSHRNAWFTRGERGRWHLDLWTALCDQLLDAGVRADQIFVSRLCTQSHPGVFESYRLDGTAAGRMAGIVVVPPGEDARERSRD